MRITFIPMAAIITSTIIHVPLCILFVYGLDLDIRGLAIATSCKDAVLLILVMVWGSFYSTEIRSTLVRPLDEESFRGWCEYLKISLPSTVMFCAEMWAFGIFTVLAGTLGVTELACNTIIYSISSFSFEVAVGIQLTSCALIGNCIGVGNVPLAKRFFTMISKVMVLVILIVASLIFFLRNQISAAYTRKPEI